MKKSIFLPIFGALSLIFFAGCGSTKVEAATEPAQEEPEPEPEVQTESEIQPEPEPEPEKPRPKITIEVETAPEPTPEPKISEPKITKTVPNFRYTTYTVKKKDDYHKIALKFYKVRHLWPCVYEANIQKYPNPDYIRRGTKIRVPQILSISREAENIKAGMFRAYKGYLNQISPRNSRSKNAKITRRAVGVLVSAELLIPHFIDDNAERFDKDHISQAKKTLRKSYGYKIR